MENIEERVIVVEQRSKSNSHRLDEAERKLADYGQVITSIQVLSHQQKTMDGDLKEIKSDVKKLAEKPARRWDRIVQGIIDAIVLGLVAYVMVRFGLG